MTDLSMVRIISHVGVRLAVGPGSGGQPTARWQDKSREVRSGRSAEERHTIQRSQTMCAATRQGAHSKNANDINAARTSHMEPL
jgi:hypothetical protein